MVYRYTLNILNNEGSIISYALTNAEQISIGSGLFCHVRVQLPSIEEVHLKIYMDHGKITAFGKDVKLNNNILEMSKKYDYKLGDIVQIHGKGFQVKSTDPLTVIDQAKVIRECPENLKYLTKKSCDVSYIEVEDNLFINGIIDKENKIMNEEKDGKNNNQMEIIGEDISMKSGSESIQEDFKEEFNNNEEFKINNGGEFNKNNEEFKINNGGEFNNNGGEEEKMEIIHDDQKNLNSEVVTNILIENNEIVTNEVYGDLHTKKETNITREVVSSHYIKEGIIYQEVKEKINIEEIKEEQLQEDLKKDIQEEDFKEKLQEEDFKEDIQEKLQEEDFKEDIQEEDYKEDIQQINNLINYNQEDIKSNFDLQTAVKIIDASSSETKAEEALEEGDLSSVKNAIINKQEEIDEEIKESIDLSVGSDTPINPSFNKKISKDLGDAIIEKEILKDAERVVDNKINENSEQSLELTKLIKEVEKEEETKTSLENPFFDLSKEEISETINESYLIKKNIKSVSENNLKKEFKTETSDNMKNKDNTEFEDKIINSEQPIAAIEEKEVQKVDDKELEIRQEEDEPVAAIENKEVKKVDDKEIVIPENENLIPSKENKDLTITAENRSSDDENKEFSKSEESNPSSEHDTDKKKNKNIKKYTVNDDASKKKTASKKRKQKEIVKKKKSKGSDEEKEQVGYNNLTILKDETKSTVSKSSEDVKTKSKPISKLTLTPRSTRKASMVSHAPPVIPATQKRVKRSASSSSSDSKKPTETSTKKNKSKK